MSSGKTHLTDQSNDEISRVLEKVIVLCNPTKTEENRIASVAAETKKLVEQQVANNNNKDIASTSSTAITSAASPYPEIKDVIFGGSFAKGTWLRGDADIDIFIRINPSVSEEKFESLGVNIGSSALKMKKYKPRMRYSDHPYVEAIVKGIRVNIVPCYDVQDGQWQSAADRSPFHTRFITKTLDDAQRADVRLLKKFLKSAGIYGAEISTGGFSGYVSEVFVAKYGTFEGVLAAAASKFRQGQIISIGDNADVDYDSDIVKGFTSFLIIIDPVDPRRNLGTAISAESVGRFILAARAFLRRPSLDFFVQQRPSINKKLYGNVLIAEFSHRERSPDTIWGQLKRSSISLVKQLEIAGFTVFRATCNTDEKQSGVFAFLLESLVLPKYAMRKGPEIMRENDTESFIKAARALELWVDKEFRVSTIVQRKNPDAKKFLEMLLCNNAPETSGVAKDMITSKVKIYSANEKKKIKGLVREAVEEITSTERLIFNNDSSK